MIRDDISQVFKPCRHKILFKTTKIWMFSPQFRHILAAIHFNVNLNRDNRIKKSDGSEHCTSCGKPMKGHNNVLDCPRNKQSGK